VQDRHTAPEAREEAPHGERRQGDLWHQDQGLATPSQGVLDRLEIDLRLARTGHSMEQEREEAALLQGFSDQAHCLSLGRSELGGRLRRPPGLLDGKGVAGDLDRFHLNETLPEQRGEGCRRTTRRVASRQSAFGGRQRSEDRALSRGPRWERDGLGLHARAEEAVWDREGADAGRPDLSDNLNRAAPRQAIGHRAGPSPAAGQGEERRLAPHPDKGEELLLSGAQEAAPLDDRGPRGRHPVHLPGQRIEPGRKRGPPHRAPGAQVVFRHPAGELQEVRIQEGFGIQDLAQVLRLRHRGAVARFDQIPGHRPRPERDQGSLPWHHELPHFLGHPVGERRVHGRGEDHVHIQRRGTHHDLVMRRSGD
jgi:hypothetical protein